MRPEIPVSSPPNPPRSASVYGQPVEPSTLIGPGRAAWSVIGWMAGRAGPGSDTQTRCAAAVTSELGHEGSGPEQLELINSDQL